MISTEQMRVKIQGDGETRRFTFPFLLDKASDLLVRIWDGETLATVTDWTIEPINGIYPTTGGAVIYPASASAVSSDITVIIERNIAIIQNDGYKRNDSLSMTSLEKTFDSCVERIQEVSDIANRSIQLSVQSDYEDISVELPIPKPNMGFYWDETGTKLVEGLNPKDAAEQAAASAGSAKASENAAAGYAAQAENDKIEVEQAVKKAEESRDAAAESAATAAQKANSARDSAEEAETWATKARQPLIFKGGVETYDELPTNPSIGDYYHIEKADEEHGILAGNNVGWNGTQWVNMGNTEGVAIATDPEIQALFDGVVPEYQPDPEHAIATDPEIRALF